MSRSLRIFLLADGEAPRRVPAAWFSRVVGGAELVPDLAGLEALFALAVVEHRRAGDRGVVRVEGQRVYFNRHGRASKTAVHVHHVEPDAVAGRAVREPPSPYRAGPESAELTPAQREAVVAAAILTTAGANRGRGKRSRPRRK